MPLSRRHLLAGAALLPLAAPALRRPAAAQTVIPPSAPMAAETPPILFVHGNGDQAPVWMTTLWRMQSNGIAAERMLAFNFTNPNARTNDSQPQPNKSSTADQLREFEAAVQDLMQRTGAARVAAVASSRGGYALRNYLATSGGAKISHAVLCGVPSHGVFALDGDLDSEFNGNGGFLRKFNNGDTEVVEGTATLTLRSDGNDKYAQADGRFIGKPGTTTGVTFDGPALRGAINLVLPGRDHRELAFSPRAFAEIYKFISGNEPGRIAIAPEPSVRLSGLVTGVTDGVATNLPVAAARLEIFRVSPDTGERIGAAIYSTTTAADGRWGPAELDPTWCTEMVLQIAGAPITHTYRSPFARSSDIVHLRPGRVLGAADAGAGAVVLMTRPRGYFGLPRDIVLLDGGEPKDIGLGVPRDATTTLRLLPAETGRPVVAIFNQERIVMRAWPAAENRITIAELTY